MYSDVSALTASFEVWLHMRPRQASAAVRMSPSFHASSPSRTSASISSNRPSSRRLEYAARCALRMRWCSAPSMPGRLRDAPNTPSSPAM